MNLQGNVALVSGATRGIGKAIALDLARQGAVVVGTATSVAGADAISAYLRDAGVVGRGTVLDINDQASITQVIGDLEALEGSCSILVNNAGITRDNLLLRMREEEWSSVIETNLTSIYRMSKACLRPMLKARHGRIVNIGSVVGAIGNAGQANYAAAKAGLLGFTKALAREVASRGVTVNAVAPGFIDTDMTRALSESQRQGLKEQIPLARFGTVDDVAAAVSFLVSPAAGYITGETLHVNGGMYMS